MKHISEYNLKVEQSPPKGTGKAARRKLAIDDVALLVGWKGDDLWKRFSYPLYVPTEWIEGWMQALVATSIYKRRDKLFELLNETRGKKKLDMQLHGGEVGAGVPVVRPDQEARH